MNGLGGFHEERFVSRVEGKLDALLSRGHGKLDEAARHICLAPKAKRARPRLCYLFGQALGVDSPLLEDVAVTVELIHTASLLHDDVIDEGDVRRGFPTQRKVGQFGGGVDRGLDALRRVAPTGKAPCPSHHGGRKGCLPNDTRSDVRSRLSWQLGSDP